jgi:hypothetical protein
MQEEGEGRRNFWMQVDGVKLGGWSCCWEGSWAGETETGGTEQETLIVEATKLECGNTGR